MNTDFVVLAAGEGKRMLGADPKVLLPVAGKPMAQHTLDTISEIKKSRTILVSVSYTHLTLPTKA